MLKVIQTRSGCPDKFRKFTSGNYELIQRDQHNLCDFSFDEIRKLPDDVYVACAGDEDVIFSGYLPEDIREKLGKRLFLPYGPNGLFDVNKFYPKDSEFYMGLTDATGIYYPLVGSYTLEEFAEHYKEVQDMGKFVVKVQKGSGSRGVYVINPDRDPQVGSREQYKSWEPWMRNDLKKWTDFTHSRVLVQKLAYTDLDKQVKYNCNAIIRNGKLVLYKLNVPDNDSTNYDHAKFVRNEFTDRFMNKLVEYYKSKGITDILIGIDGYTDFVSYISAIECNCRYENSFFEFEAFGIDFMDAYLFPEKYSMDMIPFGEYPFIRYWRCAMFNLKKEDKLYE